MERNYETIILISFYYIFINIISFTLFFLDKQKAIKNQWRISENTLFTFFALGGTVGGFFSMKFFHHKTKKPKFYIIGLIFFFLHMFFILTIANKKA